jgi:hypothetical protein
LTSVSNAGGSSIDGLSRIESIEIIDMAVDTTSNTLTLALKDVLDMTSVNVFNSTNTGSLSGTAPLAASVNMHQLMIAGSVRDYLVIGVGDWTASATNTAITYGPRTYMAYTYNSTSVYVQLLIDQNLSGHIS